MPIEEESVHPSEMSCVLMTADGLKATEGGE
jgi:hypothetical protein